MTRISGVLAAWGIAMAAWAAGAEPPAQSTELDRAAAIRGERSYRTYCASCHGREAKGDGPLAKDLKVGPADLTQLSAKHEGTFPFEVVVETILHGRDVRGHGSQDMPAWGNAFEMTSESEDAARQKVEELAHYIWSIQAK